MGRWLVVSNFFSTEQKIHWIFIDLFTPLSFLRSVLARLKSGVKSSEEIPENSLELIEVLPRHRKSGGSKFQKPRLKSEVLLFLIHGIVWRILDDWCVIVIVFFFFWETFFFFFFAQRGASPCWWALQASWRRARQVARDAWLWVTTGIFLNVFFLNEFFSPDSWKL